MLWLLGATIGLVHETIRIINMCHYLALLFSLQQHSVAMPTEVSTIGWQLS